jgi:hypothetical protein
MSVFIDKDQDMRTIHAALAIFALFAIAQPAVADEPLSKLSCFHPYYFCPVIEEPYRHDGVDHTNRPRDRAPERGSDWHPQDWIAQRDSREALINGFYNSGILSAQYTNDRGMQILEVGPYFYHLSLRDRRRVADVISYLYRPGTFYITDWHSREIIASYTPRHGLTRE